MNHSKQQKEQSNLVYSSGSRQHVVSKDVVTKFIVSWRVEESFMRLVSESNGLVNYDSSILVLCSGEGMEGSILCDMGFKDVTVSDLAENGVRASLERDSRLKGVVLNAERIELPDDGVDVVLVQDGLHHLSLPVQGFTEMLRVARKGVVFLEAHNTFVCHVMGTKWEKNGSAINYVFRWDKDLVEQVSSSALGQDRFKNISFSFWHHNMVFARLPILLGSTAGLIAIKVIKILLDGTMGKFGNAFCGLVLKREKGFKT